MNKEIEDALHMLLHCSLKDTEYETQVEQYKIVRNYITNLEQENNKYKEVITKLIEYLQEKYDSSGLCGIVLNFTEFEDIKDLLKEVE